MATELEYWRATALWMAECHAATAHIFNDRKSASASDKRRFKAIANSCAALIRDGGGDVSLSRYIRDCEGQTEEVYKTLRSASSP